MSSLALGASLAAAAAVLSLTGAPGETAAAPTVLRPGCPAVVPGSSSALDDYADLFVWQGRSYVSADGVPPEPGAVSPVPDPLRPGGQVTAIGCSLTDQASTGGQHIAPGPWPDGTATGLTTGTAVHAVRGVDPGCVLAVARATGWTDC